MSQGRTAARSSAVGSASGVSSGRRSVAVCRDLPDHCGDLACGADEADRAVILDRVLLHATRLPAGIEHHGQTLGGMDCRKATGPVIQRARQQDADGAVSGSCRQGLEQGVDSAIAKSIIGAWNEMRLIVLHQRQVAIRLADIADAGLQPVRLVSDDDRHGAAVGKNATQDADRVACSIFGPDGDGA